MRLSTVFISSTFVLAGMSAAFPVETEDMLEARFANPDLLSEVEARAYDEGPELYVHGGAVSANNYKTLSRHRRSFPGGWPVDNDQPDQPRVTFTSDTKGSPPSKLVRPTSPGPMGSPRKGFRLSLSNMFNRRPRTTGSSLFKGRSFDNQPYSELTRRHDWEPESPRRRVTWSSNTVDTPERPPRPPTPIPSRPQTPPSPNGNGNRYSYHRHRPRSFFDLD